MLVSFSSASDCLPDSSQSNAHPSVSQVTRNAMRRRHYCMNYSHLSRQSSSGVRGKSEKQLVFVSSQKSVSNPQLLSWRHTGPYTALYVPFDRSQKCPACFERSSARGQTNLFIFEPRLLFRTLRSALAAAVTGGRQRSCNNTPTPAAPEARHGLGDL
jgi:hypothetical protein